MIVRILRPILLLIAIVVAKPAFAQDGNVVAIAPDATVEISYIRVRDEVSQLTWYRKTPTMSEWEFVGQINTDRLPHGYAPQQFQGGLPAGYEIRLDATMLIGSQIQPFGRLERRKTGDDIITLLYFGNPGDADPNTIVTFKITYHH